MHGDIRVLLVDDRLIVSEAFAALLEATTWITEVGEATDIEMARLKACTLRPDVILLDLRLENQHGIEIISALLDDNPAIRMVIFRTHADAQGVAAAFRAGAVGYILKTQAVINGYNGQSSAPHALARSFYRALFPNPTR